VQHFDDCDGLVSAILHVSGDVSIGTNRGTGGEKPVCVMLDIEGVRCLLSGCVSWARGGTIDGHLVEGGRKTDCSALLYKCVKGRGDSWRGSDAVCVIGVSNWVHGRVRSGASFKSALKHQCEVWRFERAPLAYSAGEYNVDSVCLGRREESYSGMSALHEVRNGREGGVPGCHSGNEISPVDNIEGVTLLFWLSRSEVWR
jgi:hypothetical protein